METPKKIHIEIWSDIMCPFCYIGKRHFEEALKQFGHRAEIEIQWRSFQLDPTIPLKRDKIEHVYEYLAKRKNITYDESVKLHERVMEMAQEAGLAYHFDIAIVANSFDAHRLIQLAKLNGLGNEIEERLFKAYFTDGMDLGDPATLVELGTEVGLKMPEIKDALQSEEMAKKVEEDILEANRLGVRGVPFFVFNRKYAVSGAQPAQAFVTALEKTAES